MQSVLAGAQLSWAASPDDSGHVLALLAPFIVVFAIVMIFVVVSSHPPEMLFMVFLGYAAGVGKTYAMLEAAHQRKRQGVDVVVGYVETHGRVETDAFVSGLEVLPRRQVEYHGIRLPEMDLDAVLQRSPQLVLVDELAHTNAAGSRHARRYQDVEELLDAGEGLTGMSYTGK